MTAGLSAIMHVLAIGVAVGLPILYASDELPTPPDMMAFVMEASVPPPPPPAPAPPPPPSKKPEIAKPNQPALETAKPTPAASSVALLVESRRAYLRLPPPPKPQGPIRVGGQIKAPELVHRVNPTYPPVAQNAQVQGSVVLEATVDKSGPRAIGSRRAIPTAPRRGGDRRSEAVALRAAESERPADAVYSHRDGELLDSKVRMSSREITEIREEPISLISPISL
jgi:hypothetical protein